MVGREVPRCVSSHTGRGPVNPFPVAGKGPAAGAGGAGFPTHVKLEAKADIFLVNAAECEPMLRTDQQLMAVQPDLLLRGLELGMQSTGASEGIIALKPK